MSLHSRAFVFYTENWAMISQLQAFECAGANGWRGREHVGWLFIDGDSALQELLRTHLILPNILGTSLQNILMKLLVAGCRRSKRHTNHCTPSSSALYGADALHVLALRKCAVMWLLFPCRNTRISFNLAANQMGPLDAHKSLNFQRQHGRNIPMRILLS